MEKEKPHLMTRLVAVHFPLTWINYSKEIGLPVEPIMHRYGIVESDIISKRGISLQKFGKLLIEILELTPKHEIGFEVGWRLPITAYGNLGQAILSSNNLSEAIQICILYWDLIAREFLVNVNYSNDLCIITLNINLPIEANLRRIIFEATLASLYKGCITLEPKILELGEVWFEGDAPDYANVITNRIKNSRFGMPLTQIRFPSYLLNNPLPMASQLGLQTALQCCQEELQALGLQEKMTQKVKEILVHKEKKYRSLDDVALLLNISPRTLRRKLNNENTSFSALLEDLKRYEAMSLLDNTNLSISEIALSLSYNDVANFTRVFKKWTGMTPSNYRANTLVHSKI